MTKHLAALGTGPTGLVVAGKLGGLGEVGGLRDGWALRAGSVVGVVAEDGVAHLLPQAAVLTQLGLVLGVPDVAFLMHRVGPQLGKATGVGAQSFGDAGP